MKTDVDILAEKALSRYPLIIDYDGSRGVPGTYSLGGFEIKDQLGTLSLSFKGERLGTIKDEGVKHLFVCLRRAVAHLAKNEKEDMRTRLFAEAFEEVDEE